MTILNAGLVSKRGTGHDSYLVTLSLVQTAYLPKYKTVVVPNSSGNIIVHRVKHDLHRYFLEN
jgi:hypothetical protein